MYVQSLIDLYNQQNDNDQKQSNQTQNTTGQGAGYLQQLQNNTTNANQPPTGYMPNINPTPTGTNTPGQTVTANMASQQPQQTPNGWIPPPGYLDGSAQKQQNIQNMPGSYQKGYGLGQIAAQQLINSRDANNRANETQSFTRQAFTKEQQISMGMQQAAAQGGYGGVVDYLNTADPERSLKIQQTKTDLDTSMLKADSLATMTDLQKKDALFQGYGLLGKMGATLLSSPADQRSSLYQTMLPMVKAINPDAPDTLNQQATNMFLLGAGQASPDNALWSAKQDVLSQAGEVEKASDRLQALAAAGVPTTSPKYQAATLDYQNAKNTNTLKQANVDDLSTKQTTSQQQSNTSNLNNFVKFQDTVDKQSKDMMSLEQPIRQFNVAQAAFQKNPQDPTAIQNMAAAISNFAGVKKINPNIMNYFLQTDSKAGDLMNNIESAINGKDQKYLTSKETIGRISQLGQDTIKLLNDHQNQIINQYKPIADKYLGDDANNINWHSSIPVSPTGIKTPSEAQLLQDANTRIKNGQPPQEVVNLLQQVRQKYGYIQ